jgi:hypothetical protein
MPMAALRLTRSRTAPRRIETTHVELDEGVLGIEGTGSGYWVVAECFQDLPRFSLIPEGACSEITVLTTGEAHKDAVTTPHQHILQYRD